MVISEVFRDPAPDAPLAGPVMLLEGLQAGIAGQLAVLDDAGLTGTGQSSADVLGVPGTVLAGRLTGHLVREIIVRGSGGGPLAPLADQLNHELTRLQGQRIEGMLAWLAADVRDALARPDSGVTVAGRPLEEVTDPFALEVHRPVQPEDAPPGLPVLPPYVPREHDAGAGPGGARGGRGPQRDRGAGGRVLMGKTRACWEALQLLRDQARPVAAVASDRPVPPRCGAAGAGGYRAADRGVAERGPVLPRPRGRRAGRAGRRRAARAAARPGPGPGAGAGHAVAPVLGHPDRPPGRGCPDPHAQARELLAGHDITVPAAFTPAQLDQLGKAGDARLALAAAAARDGQVIQFLAGAPELLARYRNAPPAAAALIDAAMDARRLGMGAGLPRAFLEAAVPGYLTEAEWDALGEDWLEQALAYAAVPCKGVPGPLTCIRPRPPRSRPARPGSRDGGEQPLAGPTGPTGGPVYRLADYLDQHGRQHRKSQIPPAGFWAAAADHVSPADQAALGDAADARGLYRDAAQLHKNAAAAGNLRAASYLSGRPSCLRDDARPVRWAVAHAVLDDPGAGAQAGRLLRAHDTWRGRLELRAGPGHRAAGPRSCRPRLPR